MSLAVAEGDFLSIQETHLRKALSMFEEIEKTMMFAFNGAIFGAKAQWQDKVLTKIQTEGEIGHMELMRHFHYTLGSRELRDVINTLIEEERVERYLALTGGRQKMTYRYVGEVKKEV